MKEESNIIFLSNYKEKRLDLSKEITDNLAIELINRNNDLIKNYKDFSTEEIIDEVTERIYALNMIMFPLYKKFGKKKKMNFLSILKKFLS